MYQVLSILFLIGRIISGGFFLMGGFNHFKNANMYAAYETLSPAMRRNLDGLEAVHDIVPVPLLRT